MRIAHYFLALFTFLGLAVVAHADVFAVSTPAIGGYDVVSYYTHKRRCRRSRPVAPTPSERGGFELALLSLQIRFDIRHDRLELASLPNGVEVMRQQRMKLPA